MGFLALGRLITRFGTLGGTVALLMALPLLLVLHNAPIGCSIANRRSGGVSGAFASNGGLLVWNIPSPPGGLKWTVYPAYMNFMELQALPPLYCTPALHTKEFWSSSGGGNFGLQDAFGGASYSGDAPGRRIDVSATASFLLLFVLCTGLGTFACALFLALGVIRLYFLSRVLPHVGIKMRRGGRLARSALGSRIWDAATSIAITVPTALLILLFLFWCIRANKPVNIWYAGRSHSAGLISQPDSISMWFLSTAVGQHVCFDYSAAPTEFNDEGLSSDEENHN